MNEEYGGHHPLVYHCEQCGVPLSPGIHCEAGLLVAGPTPAVLGHLLDDLGPLLVKLLGLLLEMIPPVVLKLSGSLLVAPDMEMLDKTHSDIIA